jgi:hypothetical protein
LARPGARRRHPAAPRDRSARAPRHAAASADPRDLEIGATPDDLRYRLAGGVIVDAFGFEPTGLTRRQIRAARVTPDRHAEFDRTSRETHEVAARCLVAYTHDHMTSYARDYLAYARLNLPVSEDGVRGSGVFGALFLSSDRDFFWQDDFTELHVTVPLAELG